MNYSFSIHHYIDQQSGKAKKSPLIHLENAEQYGWFFVDEIQNLSIEYVKEIIKDLEVLIAKRTETINSFGYQVYSIEYNAKTATIINVLEDDKIEAILPTVELYQFLKDWYDYLVVFYNTEA